VGVVTYIQLLGFIAPLKFGRAKTSKIQYDLAHLLTLTANMSGIGWVIKNRKQTWSTAIFGLFSKNTWWILVN